MDKRYQVFVSSTYEDLQDERREVMQALLELDCIPSGMELFPASNEDQWSLIKRVIDDSDYYILIIGGRYGSTNEEGISYTEMEYRYAKENGKPIVAFLHKNPSEIKSKYTEHSETGKNKLESFRALAEKKLVRYWNNPSELGSLVSRSMLKLIKQFPTTGWIKADQVADEESLREIIKLKKANEDLQKLLQESKITAPSGTEKLSQGDDEFEITIQYTGDKENRQSYIITDQLVVSWNELFAAVSPYMTIECDESTIKTVIVDYLKSSLEKRLKERIKNKEYTNFRKFNIPNDEFQIIKIQLKALGLITKSVKNRSVKDTGNYWTLTDYGDYTMTQLIAIKNVE